MKKKHPYHGSRIVLATKHKKERILRPLIENAIGAKIIVPKGLNTDLLGTFSGEVERKGNPLEVARKKAKMGLLESGMNLCLSNEGSFGLHHPFPITPSDHEILYFMDLERDIEFWESVVSPYTNFDHIRVDHKLDILPFLKKVKFGSHGLVVCPNKASKPNPIFKGITTKKKLIQALKDSILLSTDGLALVQTDMRAHLNPSRQKVIKEVGEKFAKKLETLCPKCGSPGWGVTDVEKGLPCESCHSKTSYVLFEIYKCANKHCSHSVKHNRSDGLRFIDPGNCPQCNP